MRVVAGKSTREFDAAAFAELRSGYQRTVLDLGTGDGKHVLHVARARPETLAIGLDAAPDAMRRTAARKTAPPNALFVWAAVEQLPAELTDLDEVHVLMPWGSLLRAFAAPDERLLEAIAARCRPGASFLVTFNLHAWRPPVPDVGGLPEPAPGQLDPAYAGAGWHIEKPDGAELGTSWTKRLGSSRDALAVRTLRGTIGYGC